MSLSPADICVCTFKRPHLAGTLRSLSLLTLKPGRTIRVVVADNDETPSARELAEQTAAACGLALTYIHAPARNISVARNACLEAVTAPLFAFIDDDELATPAWLEALIEALESAPAEVALGPVKAVYADAYPGWIRDGDFHSTKPVWVHGEIRTGYSCNVLMRREAVGTLRFREEYGRSGGEDTVFFAAVHAAGGRFAYAPAAIVTEAVPEGRASFEWLLKRYFRAGQTHGALLIENTDETLFTRLRNVTVAAAKAQYCYLAALLNLLQPARWRYWILRGTLHAGAISRLLGKRELVQYG